MLTKPIHHVSVGRRTMAQCASKNVPVKGLNNTALTLVVILAGSFSKNYAGKIKASQPYDVCFPSKFCQNLSHWSNEMKY